MNKQPRTYRYIITLSREMWPRTIADIMTMSGSFARSLLTVEDCQRADHASASYEGGTTYRNAPDPRPGAESPATGFDPVLLSVALRDAAFSSRSTPTSDMLGFLAGVLERGEVPPGNAGLWDTYLKEAMVAVDEVRARLYEGNTEDGEGGEA